MKYSSTIAIMVGCAAFLASAARCHAYMKGGDSVEWLAAASGQIVAAKVIGVDWITGNDGNKYQAVTISISQTLKGKPADQETFLIHNESHNEFGNEPQADFDSANAVEWMKRQMPMLLFLKRNDGRDIPISPARYAFVLLRDELSAGAILIGEIKIELDSLGCIPAMTRDFLLLTERADILKFVAEAVKTEGKDIVPRWHMVDVPAGTDLFTKYNAGSAVWLVVPIDAKLESLGQDWCKSDDPDQRRQGARILRFFKTEKNVALLKSLLDDPSNGESTAFNTKLIYRKKVYYVREAAFNSLRKLGVNVTKPLLEVLLEGHDDPPAPDAARPLVEAVIGAPTDEDDDRTP